MPDIKILILSHSTIGIADTCSLQKCSKLWLVFSDLFNIGYPGNPCSLPFLNYVGRTLELTYLRVLQFLVPSCWGISFSYGTCLHGIWGSYFAPSTSVVLTLRVSFLMASSATLVQTAVVSQLVFSDKFGLVNESCF